MPPDDARLPDAFRLDRVDLTVADLDRSLAFYGGVLGLRAVPGPDGADDRGDAPRSVLLGAGDRGIVHLSERPGVRPAPQTATGLYHLAILVPDRATLADAVLRIARERTPVVGAADHAVSEALYLHDPDGHGVELYADRPRERWSWREGRVVLTTEALDVDGLIAEARNDGSDPFVAPAGTTLGHVHLRVRDAEEAGAFYARTVGFDEVAALPGASFLSVAGYHHHLGANAWGSQGGRSAPDDAARLLAVRADLPDAASLQALQRRLERDGVPLRSTDRSTVRFDDPSGVPWIVQARS
ncbi:MAG: VOC family protein [Trueperaceae bacterium]